MDDGFVTPTRHKLDVDTLYRMLDAGIFYEGERIELIDGDLIDMTPIGFDHAASVNGLTHALVKACDGHAIVSVQNPVRIDQHNEPQPDLVVLRLRADNYRAAPRGGPEDALLVVEVSDSSLRFDRLVKLPLYARAGFAELWIVDTRRRVLTAYTDPVDGEYGTIRSFKPEDTVALSLAPHLLVPLAGVFD